MQTETEKNRQLVLAFYELALLQKHVAEAFEQYVADDFIEHKPDVHDGARQGTVDCLTGLTKQMPDCRWELVRTIAENDLVFLHAKFFPTPNAQPYAVGDIFRIANGKIAEHWDIIAPPRPATDNPHSRF